MNENYVAIDTSFSTADTIGKAELFYKDRYLKLKFRQWNDKETTIEFKEVIGFCWDDNYLGQVKVAPDRVYEIENSVWMDELRKEIKINPNKYHHYKLYFIVEAAVLDVIARSMKEQA